MTKKRRTRKDKEHARHGFSLTWEPGPKKAPRHEVVKGQFNFASDTDSRAMVGPKNAKISAKDDYYARIKHDLARSLLLASLILSLEVVIYLIQG